MPHDKTVWKVSLHGMRDELTNWIKKIGLKVGNRNWWYRVVFQTGGL